MLLKVRKGGDHGTGTKEKKTQEMDMKEEADMNRKEVAHSALRRWDFHREEIKRMLPCPVHAYGTEEQMQPLQILSL